MTTTPPMSRAALVAFCGLLLSVSAFSCDITLPAFWSIQRDLGAPIELVQAIVPVFLMSQGLGQLIFGPVSDRFGRKPVILGGLALYLVGTVIAMLAPVIEVLHAGRAAQGFGSACGIAVGRAVLRDTSHGSGLAQAMALAMAIFALGPMTAPLIGYGLVAVGSWRAIFIGMGLFAAGLMVWGLVAFRETNARTDPEALRASRLMAALARLVRHPQSRFFLLVAASAQFGIVSFVANAPRLFKSSFGVEGLTFALLFASTGLGIVVGQIGNRRLIARFGVLAATRLAALVLLFVTVCVVGITLLGAMSAMLFTVLMFAFNTSFLAVIANSASLTIDPHPQIAGFASSVFGFFTQMTASLLVLATLPLFAGAMLPWSLGMLAVMAGVFAALVCYRGTPCAERHTALGWGLDVVGRVGQTHVAGSGDRGRLSLAGWLAPGKEIPMNMNTQQIIITVIVGIVAGWLASVFVGGPSSLIGYLLTGLIGAFVGNFVLGAVGWKPNVGNDLADWIITSAIGAIIVVILAKLIIFA